MLAKLIPGISSGAGSLSLPTLAHMAERELHQWLGLEETQLVQLLEVNSLLRIGEMYVLIQ